MSVIKIDNWSVCCFDQDPYHSPEQQALSGAALQGFVTNHPRFENGKHIITSRAIGKRKGLIIVGSGNEYELGEADPEYEKLFPSARDRLMASLSEIE